MARFSAACLVLVALSLANALPEGYKATNSKVVKIQEHEKNKNIIILKKSEINSPSGSASAASAGSSDDDSPYRESPSSGSSGSPYREGSQEDAGSLQHVGTAGGHHGKSVNGGCVPNPEPVKLYEKFTKVTLTHRMFVLSASTHYANQASLVLTGKPMSSNDPSQACLRVVWEGHRRRLQGYGNKALLNCDSEDVTDVTCYKKENKAGGSLRITYVWTDGRAHILAIMCGLGKGSWALLSNKREIGHNSKENILNIVESYGFDPTDLVDFSFTEDDCAASVRNDIQEGPCVEEDDDLETIPHKQIEAAKEILEGGVYTPMASLANIYATGMFIRGTPLKSTEDIDQTCVQDHWSKSEIVRNGFQNKESVLECDMKDFQRITCIPNEEKSDSSHVYNKHIHPVWTDGKKYVLAYHCLSTRLKTWALYSSDKSVDGETRKYILSKVADYGFDPSKAHESSYENC